MAAGLFCNLACSHEFVRRLADALTEPWLAGLLLHII